MFRKMILPAAAVAALGMAIPAAHAAQPITVPIDTFVLDDCNGDIIHIVGTEKISATVTVQNDIMHVNIHHTLHADGSGSSGRYVLNVADNTEENVKLINGTGEVNITTNANLIGRGAVANEIFRFTQHLTVNANGTVTVLRTDISMTCHK